MPKIRFINLPRPLWEHILERVAERAISLDDLQRLRSWVATEPLAPEGDWYKDFGAFVLCGTGEYPKTVLKKGTKPFGTALGNQPAWPEPENAPRIGADGLLYEAHHRARPRD